MLLGVGWRRLGSIRHTCGKCPTCWSMRCVLLLAILLVFPLMFLPVIRLRLRPLLIKSFLSFVLHDSKSKLSPTFQLLGWEAVLT